MHYWWYRHIYIYR